MVFVCLCCTIRKTCVEIKKSVVELNSIIILINKINFCYFIGKYVRMSKIQKAINQPIRPYFQFKKCAWPLNFTNI